MDHATTDVGSRLQQAREQRGLTRQDISRITKLSTSTLKAIEQNEFGRLPGGIFRAAYIRVVAAEVGLDPDGLVRTYRATLETDTPAVPSPQAAGGARSVPALGWMAAAVIAAAAVSGMAWLTSRAALPLEAQLVNAAATVGRQTAPPLVVPDATGAAVMANAVVAETGAPPLQLEIRFSGPCWVSLVADGERLIYTLMQAGEHTVVEARDAITLRVGDAGAVAYSLNGVTGRPLGGDGEAVTLRLTSNSNDS